MIYTLQNSSFYDIIIKATPREAQTFLHEYCLQIFRDFAQEFLDRRQPA